MRVYHIPPDMKEKEKVVGGILDINQLMWIGGGLALGAIIFAIFFSILGGGIALFIGGIFCVSGVPFALYRKKGLTLYQYLYRKQKFKKKVKSLPNLRKGGGF